MQKIVLLTALLTINVQAAQVCQDSIQTSHPLGFTVNQDGTVTDNQTKLVWKQCLEGLSGADCATGTASTFTWDKALQHAASQSGWRLPKIKELVSIVELKCHSPAINLAVFPNDPGGYVWSGSPYANGSNGAWYVYFYNGNHYDGSRSDSNRVRLVRDGQ